MGKPLVLVVDDEALIALDMESTLSEAGFAVALAATCSQAKRFLADHTPAAAILDVRLSDGEAVDAAKTLAGRAVPFIVYSGLGLEETPEAFSSGVRDETRRTCRGGPGSQSDDRRAAEGDGIAVL